MRTRGVALSSRVPRSNNPLSSLVFRRAELDRDHKHESGGYAVRHRTTRRNGLRSGAGCEGQLGPAAGSEPRMESRASGLRWAQGERESSVRV